MKNVSNISDFGNVEICITKIMDKKYMTQKINSGIIYSMY